MKTKLLLAFIVASSNLAAQDYQSISSVSIRNTDHGSKDLNTYFFNSTFYFDKKKSIGPIDQFAYINTLSNLEGGYTQSENIGGYDDTKYGRIGGELFVDKFVVSGRYSHADSFIGNTNNYRVSLGYLFNDNFLVRSFVHKTENIDATYRFEAKYNHQISQTDYIGFSASADEEIDNQEISATYFTQLSDGKYLKLSGEYNDNKTFDDNWSIKGQYYFNDKTSVYLQQQKNDVHSVGAKYFFTDSLALSMDLTDNKKRKNGDSITLALHVQL